MTSRDYVMQSINHIQPDKVPCDLEGGAASNISAATYAGLLDAMHAKDKTIKIFDNIQVLAEPSWEVINRLGIDIVDVGRDFDSDWKPGKAKGGIDVLYPCWIQQENDDQGNTYILGRNGKRLGKMAKSATFFDQCITPYPGECPPECLDDLDEALCDILWEGVPKAPFHHRDELDFWPRLRQNAQRLKDQGKAVAIHANCSMLEYGSFLRGMQNFLADLLVEKEFVEALYEKFLTRYRNLLEKIVTHLDGVVDIVRFADDMGVTRSPLINPITYRESIQPYHKKMCDYIHKNSSMKTFLHSCGSIYDLMPDIIEAGFDIINPIQISAEKMDPPTIKAAFGKDITFWGGGCDTIRVLPHATTEEVKRHVRTNLEVLAKDGGYIFAPSHNLLADIPPENILAMYDAAREFSNG